MSRGGGPEFETKENEHPYSQINEIRECVREWRNNGYPGISETSIMLLNHWSDPGQGGTKPYFCQHEAVETIIYLCETNESIQPNLAKIKKKLQSINSKWNESIMRYAVKMATATGKTWVMAMLILWKSYLSSESGNVLIITPNLTVARRLDADLGTRRGGTLYEDLLPRYMQRPATLNVTILNYQKFIRRDESVSNTPIDSHTKNIIKFGRADEPDLLKESSEKMLRRVLKKHKGVKQFTVINDEAHHCFPPNSDKNKEDARKNKSVAAWFNILQILNQQGKLGDVFDLSATPMFLKKPTGLPNPLFPWIISDFPLMDAIESGLTKIPIVPTDDDTHLEEPMYRNLYSALDSVKTKLEHDNLPNEILILLEKMHDKYAERESNSSDNQPTPVMIIVTNNVLNANALYKHIAGYKDDNGVWVPGKYRYFSNVKVDGTGKVDHPPTLLVHSKIDISREDSEWNEINKIQRDFFPKSDDASNQEYMEFIRDVFGTVGIREKLGEKIRCVISVSMLTEGWDAKTVSYIFGFRPFESQLLCEQVAGRALRRSIPLRADIGGLPEPEYASIYGVPFNFMVGSDGPVPVPHDTYDVYTMPKRNNYRLTFPNIASFQYETPEFICKLDLSKLKKYDAKPGDKPGWTDLEGVSGAVETVEWNKINTNTVIYKIAREAANKINPPKTEDVFHSRGLLFSSMVVCVRSCLASGKITFNDITQLAMKPNFSKVADLIAQACTAAPTESNIVPVFLDDKNKAHPHQLDTSNVSFSTTLENRYPANGRSTKHSELNIAACHSGPEVVMAQILDKSNNIKSWVRNYNLNWRIPYIDPDTGEWRSYEPDFVARLSVESDVTLNLIIELKGQAGRDAMVKAAAIDNYWIPAVNNSDDSACDGLWKYLMIDLNGKHAKQMEAELTACINDLCHMEKMKVAA